MKSAFKLGKKLDSTNSVRMVGEGTMLLDQLPVRQEVKLGTASLASLGETIGLAPGCPHPPLGLFCLVRSQDKSLHSNDPSWTLGTLQPRLDRRWSVLDRELLDSGLGDEPGNVPSHGWHKVCLSSRVKAFLHEGVPVVVGVLGHVVGKDLLDRSRGVDKSCLNLRQKLLDQATTNVPILVEDEKSG